MQEGKNKVAAFNNINYLQFAFGASANDLPNRLRIKSTNEINCKHINYKECFSYL